MSSSANQTAPNSRKSPWVTREQRKWLIVAFVVGLLIFLFIWNRERQNKFFKVAPVAPPTSGEEYQPLPVPLPGDTRSTLGQGMSPNDNNASAARIEETAPPPPPTPAVQAPVAPVAQSPKAPLKTIEPKVIRQVQPVYPRSLMNAGIGGHVEIRATIGSNGDVIDTSIAQPSGEIQLDRAASQAVRRWQFTPAMQNGQPVVGSVTIPFDFKPNE